MPADALGERLCCWGGMGTSLNHLHAALGNVPSRGHPEGAAGLIAERLGKVTVDIQHGWSAHSALPLCENERPGAGSVPRGAGDTERNAGDIERGAAGNSRDAGHIQRDPSELHPCTQPCTGTSPK